MTSHPWGTGYSAIGKGDVRKYWVAEVWCLFDLFGDGLERECVLTVADGRVVLQARENYIDSKIRPYATGRSARSGHSFYSVGVVDNAVRVNIDYDRFRKHSIRASEIIVNPIAFANEDVDLPDTIFDLQPGEILRGTGPIQFAPVPNTLSHVPLMESLFKGDIEEIMASPRVFQGTEGANTATEMERKVKEANRRIRSLIRGYSDMWVQTLRIMHHLNRQFTARKTAFRVLGKRAKELTDYLEIGPDTLMPEVDFEFVGLSNLHSYDLRATALQNAMQTLLPILIQNPDKVDLLGAAHKLIGLLVGPTEADEIIKLEDGTETMLPQVQENQMLLAGQEVAVHPKDNDEEHIRQMSKSGLLDLIEDKKVPERVRKAVHKHAVLHAAQAEQKRIEAEARAKDQQARMAMLPPEAGGSTGPGGRSPVAGGMSPAMTPRGETPGPADPRKSGVAGRQPAGKPQTENVT